MPLEIPLTSDPSSLFEVDIEGEVYTLQTKYNTRGSLDVQPYWTLDISLGDTPVVTGIVLALGADLLRPYALRIGGLVMADRLEGSTEATSENLGDTTILLYYTPEELALAAV